MGLVTVAASPSEWLVASVNLSPSHRGECKSLRVRAVCECESCCVCECMCECEC